jgi:hypothetical protein
MNQGRIIIGIILCIVAALFFIFMPIINPIGGYAGAIIFLILGISVIATGRKD